MDNEALGFYPSDGNWIYKWGPDGEETQVDIPLTRRTSLTPDWKNR